MGDGHKFWSALVGIDRFGAEVGGVAVVVVVGIVVFLRSCVIVVRRTCVI